MANLGYFTIDTKKEYVKLTDITGITFVEGQNYLFQLGLNGTAFFYIGAIPEGGFLISSSIPFQYTASAEDIYIKTLQSPVTLNIAE